MLSSKKRQNHAPTFNRADQKLCRYHYARKKLQQHHSYNPETRHYDNTLQQQYPEWRLSPFLCSEDEIFEKSRTEPQLPNEKLPDFFTNQDKYILFQALQANKSGNHVFPYAVGRDEKDNENLHVSQAMRDTYFGGQNMDPKTYNITNIITKNGMKKQGLTSFTTKSLNQLNKRGAAKQAYYSILKELRKLNISHMHVERVCGPDIVRVCVRTFDQMSSVGRLIRKIGQKGLLLQLGMPVQWEAKKKSLMIFIKAKSKEDGLNIEAIIQQSMLNFQLLIFHVKEDKNENLIHKTQFESSSLAASGSTGYKLKNLAKRLLDGQDGKNVFLEKINEHEQEKESENNSSCLSTAPSTVPTTAPSTAPSTQPSMNFDMISEEDTSSFAEDSFTFDLRKTIQIEIPICMVIIPVVVATITLIIEIILH